MQKFDYIKEFKDFYKPSAKQVSVVDVPEFKCIQIDGYGNPNDNPLFSDSVEALFAVSYAIKFYFKKNENIDYRVYPLEGLWWAEDMSAFSVDNKDDWQ